MMRLCGLLLLLSIAWIYRDVSRAEFVWLDKVCFYDPAWQVYANDWTALLAHHFYGWLIYFRPLVIALFAVEIRWFGLDPAAMHVVSLGLHLLNTCLVGMLTCRFSLSLKTDRTRIAVTCASMAIFGLHPALTEPVAWISCQFELVAMLFMLLGFWCNEYFATLTPRAILVSTCFFLAALSKESAVSMPLLVFFLDSVRNDGTARSWRSRSVVYAAMLLSGFVYLALRHAWLGALLASPHHEDFLSLHRLQEIAFVFVTYWRIVLWPMLGLGPLHEIDAARFDCFDVANASYDAAAILIAVAAVVFLVKKRSAGAMLVAVTIALLPVLHVLPVAFDASLYHERYAMLAVAMFVIFLPRVMAEGSVALGSHRKIAATVGASVLAGWIALSTMNIRVMLPLWSTETDLWRWMQKENPDSLTVKDHLLSTYIENNNYDAATKLADSIVAAHVDCPNCLLNAASVAIARNDADRAQAALEQLQSLPSVAIDKGMVQGYVVATAQLLALRGNAHDAEEAFKSAIAIDSLDPSAHNGLALLLFREGRFDDGDVEASRALALYAPQERATRERELDRARRAAGSVQR